MKIAALLLILFALTGCSKSVTMSKTDSGVPDTASPVKDISPAEAQTAVSRPYSQFVDVRTAEEYSGGHAARAINIPLDILQANLDRLEKNEPVYVICETGGRSQKAAQMLATAGFNNVLNVAGGTAAWRQAGLPMEMKPPHGAATVD
jgi:rhodanese-related sulfurtransferase